MIKKITWQFSPYRSVIFSNTGKYLQEVLGNEEQNQLQVFFPRKKLLQVYKQEFHQVCEKKNGKRVSPSKLECPFNPLSLSNYAFPFYISYMHGLQLMPQNSVNWKKIMQKFWNKCVFWFFLSCMHTCVFFLFMWMQLLREFVFHLAFT